MSRELLKNLIELVPETDVELLYRVIIKFIPEDEPKADEVQAFLDGKRDREKNGTVSHNEINWD